MTNATHISAPRDTQGPSAWQLSLTPVFAGGMSLGSATLARSLAG